MANPFDDAFAEGAQGQETAAREAELKRVASARAAREYVQAYREMLAQMPQRLPAEPEVLSVYLSDDVPAVFVDAGISLKADRGRLGTCEAWRFVYGRHRIEGGGGWAQSTLYVSSDRTTVFTLRELTKPVAVRSGFRTRSVCVECLAHYIDVATERHTLTFPASRSHADAMLEDGTWGWVDLGIVAGLPAEPFPHPDRLPRIVAGLE